MQKFPIKIDLSMFFDDERKYAIILVDPQWPNVECLQRRVENIFDVQAVLFQTSDNFFIPPQESIEVLKFAEALKAFIPRQWVEKSRRKSKKSTRRNEKEFDLEDYVLMQDDKEQENVLPVEEEVLKKRKFYQCGSGFSSSTPNQAKRLRHTTGGTHAAAPMANGASKSLEITSTSEQPNENGTEEANENGEVKVKRKRKRQRNKSAVTATEEEENMNVDDSTLTQVSGLPSSTCLSEQNVSKVAKNATQTGQHTRFNETADLVSTTNEPEPANVIFRCNLEKVEAQKPRVFPVKLLNAPGSKPDIEIQENIILPMVVIPANNYTENNEQQEKEETDPVAVTQADSVAVNQTEVDEKTQEDTVEVAPDEVKLEQTSEDMELSEFVTEMTQLSEPQIPNDTVTEIENESIEEPRDSIDVTHESTQLNELDESSVIDLDEEERKAESGSEPELTEVIDLSENDENHSSVSPRKSTCNVSTRSSDHSFNPFKMTALELLPYATKLKQKTEIGDILIFKFERKNSAGKTVISNYVAGKCEYINRRTKHLKIAIIDVESERDRIPPHLLYNMMDDSGHENYFNIKAVDMIDTRVVRT